MKKLIFGLTAIVIVITGIFAFAGCEKEENEQEDQCATCESAHFYNWSAYFEQQRHYFEENYGIDLFSFYGDANFQQLIMEINDMTSDIYEFITNTDTDPAQLDKSRQFLEQKAEELRVNQEAENTHEMLSVAEEIFATLMPTKPMNEYIYEGNTFQLPIEYMENKIEALSNAMLQLEAYFPLLQDMPCTDYQTLLQISFIASEKEGYNGLCYAKQEPPTPSTQQIRNCIDQAKTSYNWCYAGAVAVAAIGLAGCTGSTFFAALCASGVITSYAVAMGDCWESYNLKVELCRLKGSRLSENLCHVEKIITFAA